MTQKLVLLTVLFVLHRAGAWQRARPMQIPILPEPFQSVGDSLTQIIAYFTSTPINAGLTGLLLLSLFWLFYVPHPLGEDFTPPVSQARQRLDTSSAYTALPLDHPKSIEFVSYTPKTLALFDGTGSEQSPDGSKILLAINGKVFDVSSGRNFYGPGGPYGNFAGRDASRGMAKQSFDLCTWTADPAMLTPLDQPIDTLEDLTDSERYVYDLMPGKTCSTGSRISPASTASWASWSTRARPRASSPPPGTADRTSFVDVEACVALRHASVQRRQRRVLAPGCLAARVRARHAERLGQAVPRR